MGTGGTTSSWILLMEVFYQGIGINVDQGFPAIVCLGVPFPPDKVLELIAPSSCAHDLFYFPFGLTVN